MKLKYYLRGLGIGIVVTAAVMGVSLNKAEKVEEIPQKDTVLSEMEENSTTETYQSEVESIEQESSTTESFEEKSTEEETSKEETSAEELSSSEIVDEGQLIPIVINSGDGSDRVSRKLAEANMVESASAFDQFLCQNGYDKKLVIGTHMIPSDATDDEIAKILCSRN